MKSRNTLMLIAALALVLGPTLAVAQEEVVEKTVEVRHGKVMVATGMSTIIRIDDGPNKGYHRINHNNMPENVKLMRDGQPIGIADLKAGDNLTALVITSTEVIQISEDEAIEVARQEGATQHFETASAAPAPAPRPEPMPAELPSTGGPLPLLLLLGAVSLATGTALRIARKR